jgi:hypothetical protein
MFGQHSPLLRELSKRPTYLQISGAKLFLSALGSSPKAFFSP